MALDLEQKVFVVYVTIYFIKPMKVHSDHKVRIVALIANKTFITVLAEY